MATFRCGCTRFCLVASVTALGLIGEGAAEEQTVTPSIAKGNELIVTKAPVPAAGSQAANEELVNKLEFMEKRVERLENELKEKTAKELKTAARDSVPAKESKPAGQENNKKGPASPAGGLWWAAPETAGPSSGAPSLTSAAPLSQGSPETAPQKQIFGLVDSPVAGMSIGAYGEIQFGYMQNPAANGQWQNGFDAHRVVLLPTYQITSNIIFNAEIEFEHAGTGFDADDKLHGTAEIEQVWIDFKIIDAFNIRSPGIDLIPIGYINEHHEPTQFYSVFRPELYNGLIPSTWKAPAASIYGTITDGLKYQVQASSSLEDFGGDFSTRGDNNKVPAGGYPAGIDGLNALSFSLPVRGDFKQLSNTVAVAAKLEYSPAAIPGFSGSTSAYFSPNTTPRGAYSDTGAALGNSSLTIIDSEFRYRIPNTGFEFRGEGVFVNFGNPANLRANNDSDPTNNVGKTMYGASGEIAYHIPLGTILNSEWEAVPFYRYTYENLQTGGFAGTDLNTPTGAGQLQFHTTGIAVFPSPKVVLKLNYQRVIDNEPGGAKADSVLGAVGFFF